ncbi:MAG: alanyl-tRNA synthetase, alanyl-tRNA synthetase [Candidatus Peregrinibacteria bacterium GW2011_GWE2_39_6]|nr:MAG: alanyl-tRNA synthetase, alanyl-tRNA synthetase [Candidatus Peregrinibacteria bacterium GW2011_GWF2_39_17]KKR24778.1 MAG: alanyl-tRNA synthetase, alanyl-tRNA synthetase [Candidatus Peregrinibacteria bacterium GW2011_GWE2_39_6]HCW31942.1 alanine--tRNA ligase [Candidatus Peregrinibacteria bacterium]
MNSKILRRCFIDFFVQKHNHAEISGASLIPENDPTVLFTTAGMHPLVPYLMGEKHPQGQRLVDVQKCLRTDDIDEVGDATHLTFFEMLGNWSLGDYFKKEAIQMSYEFLTTPMNEGGLGLDPDRLCVTCFQGDGNSPKDEEAAEIWESVGFVRSKNTAPDQKRHIFFYPKKDNWWGPAGQTGPCGPDTEMFYYTGKNLENPYEKGGPAENKEWVEIWNDVFMQYNKNAEGTFEPLKQQNVDTGLGLERVATILQGVKSPFETDLFVPIIDKIFAISKINSLNSQENLFPLTEEDKSSSRIIADHLRAAIFLLADPRTIKPSNTDQGYVLRKLIRRAVRHGFKLGIKQDLTKEIAPVIINLYQDIYPELKQNQNFILEQLQKEEIQFSKTIEQGLREFSKIEVTLSGQEAFSLYETHGFPLELIQEEAKNRGISLHPTFESEFQQAFEKHQEKSREGAAQKFSGGLADDHEETVKLHTATHLLHRALRDVLGDHVYQKGSNITQERLRFDFSHSEKMTPEQLQEVEKRVNEAIQDDYSVSYQMMTVDEAKKRGAIGVFSDRYDEKIKMYSVGDYSREICGGPHVSHTNVLGQFKIQKEESCGTGVRRIKAVVNGGESGFEFAKEQ